jgi:hypothetical protein
MSPVRFSVSPEASHCPERSRADAEPPAATVRHLLHATAPCNCRRFRTSAIRRQAAAQQQGPPRRAPDDSHAAAPIPRHAVPTSKDWL